MLLKYHETGEIVSSQQEMGYLSNFFLSQKTAFFFFFSKILCLQDGWLFTLSCFGMASVFIFSHSWAFGTKERNLDYVVWVSRQLHFILVAA